MQTISSKLKQTNKITKEFEVMLGSLSLENVIALRLELAARPVKGKFYLPLHKALIPIIKQAAVYFASSVADKYSILFVTIPSTIFL